MSKKTPSVQEKNVSEDSRKHFKYRSNSCLNCGQPLDLSDVYCSYCSQLNSTKALSLKDFISEFFSSVISYDSRLRYTIKDLLFRPGRITRNYVTGQRLKYANPFRFFLSVSIIYFLLYSFVSYFSADATNNGFQNFYGGVEKGKEENPDVGILNIQIDSTKEARDKVVTKDTLLTPTYDTETPSEKIGKEYEYNYTYLPENELQNFSATEQIFKRFNMYRGFQERTEIKNSEKALDSLKHPKTAFNKWIYGKVDSVERIKDNPVGFVNYMIQKTPFFLFFLSPLFAVFLWILYSRKKHTYMEHLVFIFHIFSFVFLALLIAMIPDLIFGVDVLQSILFLLVGPFYFYKALRNYYQQNRLITILKFVFLNIFFWFSALIAGLIFFFISAAFY